MIDITMEYPKFDIMHSDNVIIFGAFNFGFPKLNHHAANFAFIKNYGISNVFYWMSYIFIPSWSITEYLITFVYHAVIRNIIIAKLWNKQIKCIVIKYLTCICNIVIKLTMEHQIGTLSTDIMQHFATSQMYGVLKG